MWYNWFIMTNNEPRDISFEVLQQNPDIYRNQLTTLVSGLGWERSVRDYLGEQAFKIVEFCLDSKNINLIYDTVEDLLNKPDKTEQANDDVVDMLSQINSYHPVGRNTKIEEREKTERRRLVCWIIYLDILMESAKVELVNVPDDDQNSAA